MSPAASRKACRGVEVRRPLTVKIELSRPDATFLHVMAINFAIVVPKEEVEKYGADFGKHPVGTGAFKMAEWTLGQRLVFKSNADYWHKGLLLHIDKHHLRDRPGADRRPSAPAEWRGRRSGRRRSAGQVPGGPQGRSRSRRTRVVEGGQLQTGYVTHEHHKCRRSTTSRCARPSTWRSTRTASSS
ncbi:MAG: ABC transporter substrate-binding protein [Stutzerimonas stutzeri]